MAKLSIITNFGCKFNCPYCIVKQTNAVIPNTSVEGLSRLQEAAKHFGIDSISISGGGDPLYRIKDHYDWWNALFQETEKLNSPVEIHTHQLPQLDRIFFRKKISRVVYHADRIEDLFKIHNLFPYNIGNTIRVVFVVDQNMTEDDIKFISKFVECSGAIDELSFRQMVDKDFNPFYYHDQLLKKGHQEGKWHYIEQKDYNYYYVEGKVYSKYSDLVKGINSIDY